MHHALLCLFVSFVTWLVLPTSANSCISTISISNTTALSSTSFSVPLIGLCDYPLVEYYCTATPPASGAALSLTVSLVGPSSTRLSLCNLLTARPSLASDNSSMTRCGSMLLNDSWSISVDAQLSGAPSSSDLLWSFSFLLTMPNLQLGLNNVMNIISGPGMYRTYALNLTSQNGSQDLSIEMSGDVSRFTSAALWGSDACPTNTEAHTWHGNASFVSFAINDVKPNTYYLTLLQNEHALSDSGAVQLLVRATPSSQQMTLPSWWPWATCAVGILGVASFYVLLDAMRSPLGPQRERF